MPDTTPDRAPGASAAPAAAFGFRAPGDALGASTTIAPIALLLWIVPACSDPIQESMRDEARFLPDDQTLEQLEASLRDALHPTLAGYSLVDREPTERQEIHVYCDTGNLHLLNQGSALYHAFVTLPAPRPVRSSWHYDRLLDRTRLWRSQLRGNPETLDEHARPGATILARIEALDGESEIIGRIEGDLGWLPELRPRVLMGITSKQWEYREPSSSADTFVVRIATVRAAWWTPGTPLALDRLGCLREVAESPLAVSWKELTFEQEQRPGGGHSMLVPSELLETYGLNVVRTREPEYRQAVSLLSE